MIFDKLCYQSKLRYENAGVKFAFAMITMCINVMSRSIVVACIVLAATGILTMVKGGIPVLRYIRCMMIPLAFLVLSTIAIVLHIQQTPMDLFAIPLGAWYLTGSRQALGYAASLIMTALSSVACLYFLAFTTPMPDILGVLRKLHCPKLLIELMLLMYRFIFLLLEVANAILTSQKCRLGNKNYKTSINSFGLLGSALMLLAINRSGKFYTAMETRCYEDTINILSEDNPPKPKAVAAVCLFDALLLLLAVYIQL